MPLILLSYLMLAPFILVSWGRMNSFKPYLIALLQLAVFGFFIDKYQLISSGEVLIYELAWIEEIGLNISLRLDGLSYIFTLLISGIGFLVFLYAQGYMKSYKGTDKFFFYLLLFSGAMMGLVLSSNFILVFIFWELTSFLSFFLISFFHEKEAARKASFQSLFITAMGGLSLLIGFILIGAITGSYQLTDWIEMNVVIKEHSLYLPAFIFIMIGVFTKSAQFPFHFWLPGAMQAPTPVSSYLHSATMVKAGVFLLARLNPVMGGTFEWVNIISFIGGLTFFVGVYFAISQKDIKAVLAYTTISALGLLVLLLGIDTRYSVKAALVFLFVHAFYKACLFMVAGIIDKKAGTRDITKLGGLIRHMPITSIVAIMALLSMAGLPPMLGFIGKELIYEAKVQEPGIAYMVLFTGVASNIIMVSISIFLIYKVFLSKKVYDRAIGKGTVQLLAGPVLLVVLSLIFGVFPGLLNKLIQPALNVICAEEYLVKLKIWHGFTNVLYLSLFTVLCGVLLAYALMKSQRLRSNWKRLNAKVFTFEFTDVFNKAISNFTKFSARNIKIIQHGSHRLYLMTILMVAAILLWVQLYFTRGWEMDLTVTSIPFYIIGLVVVILAATFASVFSKSRMATIVMLGVVGYGISLIYLYYSAVDLAITQIIVETLTLAVFVFILQKLPRFAKLSSRRSRLRDGVVALIFGGAMTMLALKAINVNFNDTISEYFIQNSYLKAYGKNIVNVILVDFRALDTLGEVTVLAVAALGVYILVSFKKKKS